MLFNCINCGKAVSSKKEVCVYCKTDLASFAADFNSARVTYKGKLGAVVKEKYSGTLLSFLLKVRTR